MALTTLEEEACREIAEAVLSSALNDAVAINRLKLEVSKKHGLKRIPLNSEVLAIAPTASRDKLRNQLRLKKVRSISGINVIGVMALPRPCPHGRCSYCPEEPGVPPSYVHLEPSAMRGIQNNYDPFAQVSSRLKQLEAIGHRSGKIEFVFQGGTFTSAPRKYQEWFTQRCLDALNGLDSSSLEEAKKLAERSSLRNVGITVETRPDWSLPPHIDHMLTLGVTRVELGVQTLYDDVYKRIERGHSVQHVIDAFWAGKDAALKIVAHMMPGLPGVDYDRDLAAFDRLFKDPELKPDMIKIYPCLVLPNTEIYDWWQKGEYQPYDTAEAVRLLADIKERVPPWLRIMRIQREIPAEMISAGARASNLRQLVHEELAHRGKKCRCIRCREIGHKLLRTKTQIDLANAGTNVLKYESSGGTELFLSYEIPESDTLVGYLRLRVPSEKAHRPEITGQHATLIREVRVYGPLVPVGERTPDGFQHRGFGEKLIRIAEEISRSEYDAKKIVVISALGTKQYYQRLGYSYDGPYMSKSLQRS